MKLNPGIERVIVDPVSDDKSDVLLQTNEKREVSKGIVVNGKEYAFNGDLVHFAPSAARPIIHEGKEYLVIKVTDIIAYEPKE